jgi:hypothetical protein
MQSIADKTIREQKEKLVFKIETLADQCGWVHGSRVPIATWVKIISDFSCERRIMRVIGNSELAKENQKFDSYYREKSEFATIKILDHIKTSLSANGLEAIILTEAPCEIGRYDVVVAAGSPINVHPHNSGRVKIEVKASLGLDLEQLERYLWDPSPLILARVMTGHVARIKPAELQSYVTFSLEELNAKVDRLLSNKLFVVPGMACTDCLDNNCIYWRRRKNGRKSMNLVTLPDIEFEEDITSFFQNLSYVAERTAIMVVEELQGLISSRNQARPVTPQLRIG